MSDKKKLLAVLERSIELQRRAFELLNEYTEFIDEASGYLAESINRSKLSEAEKRTIRELDEQGVGNNEIARRIGRPRALVSNFLHYGTTSGRIPKGAK